MEKNENSGGFKLLAIRTGKLNREKIKKGEARNYFKVLKEDTLYKFYNEYEFLDKEEQNVEVDSDKPIHFIRYTPSVPDDLYQLKWKDEQTGNNKQLDINISAIVGKNGSGKSTLLELFFLAVFLLWEKRSELLENYLIEHDHKKSKKDKKKEEKKQFKKVQNNIEKLYSDVREGIDKILKETEEKVENNLRFSPQLRKIIEGIRDYNDSLKDNQDYKTFIQNKKDKEIKRSKEIERLTKSIEFKIYFLIKNKTFCLNINSNPTIQEFENNFGGKKTEVEINLLEDLDSNFFYSVGISYSQYGLNSNIEGKWLQEIFHKNDSYQMPLVVNPMRSEGQIDFNREDELVRQRMLSNLLEPVKNTYEPNLRDLTKSKTVTHIRLKFDKEKTKAIHIEYDKDVYKNNAPILQKLFKAYFEGKEVIDISQLKKSKNAILRETYKYAYRKLTRICNTYDQYSHYFNPYTLKLNNEKVDGYTLVERIIHDESHITFKLKQALNHLKNNAFKEKKYSVKELANKIAEWKKEKKQLRINSTIDYIPPPTFKIEIELKHKDGKISHFEDMSSGEKQKIHLLYSIIYHLINLNSVSENNFDDPNFEKYNYINILFDEVEQYFHPELQRTFISDMLMSIKKMQPNQVKHLQGLNFLFATHSPFILSDIPNQNTLKLKEGKPEEDNKQTFAANIHELLACDFFMENGFMGEFAKEKIEECIKFLNLENIYLQKQKIDEKLNEQKKNDKELKRKKENLLFEFNTILKLLGHSQIEKTIRPEIGRQYFKEKDFYLNRIKLIGEPVLRNKLYDMYADLFEVTEEESKRKEFIRLAEELGIDEAKKLLN